MSLSDDVQVSDVLGPRPDEETVQSLVDADVVPPERGAGSQGRPAAERDEEVVELLRAILDELQDADATTQGEL